MNLEHSKTLQCLVNAFAGESQARNRYTFFSKVAKEEGYEQISDIFLVTAENEKEHAKLFYKQIPDSKHFQVNGTYPFSYGDTYSNLIAAASGEREEWEILYKEAALKMKVLMKYHDFLLILLRLKKDIPTDLKHLQGC